MCSQPHLFPTKCLAYCAQRIYLSNSSWTEWSLERLG